MAWEVWWALVLGFFDLRGRPGVGAAGADRARARRRRRRRPPPAPPLLGAASSSCSYAAVAIAPLAVRQGRLGGQRARLPVRLDQPRVGARAGAVGADRLAVHARRVPRRDRDDRADGAAAAAVRQPEREEARRARTREAADPGHQHHSAGAASCRWRERLRSAQAWSDVAHNFRGDWQMLWREIAIGFLLAGFVAQIPNHFFRGLFLHHAPAPLPALENAVVGPLIAVLSFVCSVGNVPLAAVLWSGGISFAGVLAFLFADLIVLPILAIYRKYYGARLRAADHRADVRDDGRWRRWWSAGASTCWALIPTGPRPAAADVFGAVHVDYKLALNVLGAGAVRGLFALTVAPRRDRPGLRDERRPRRARSAAGQRARPSTSAPSTARRDWDRETPLGRRRSRRRRSPEPRRRGGRLAPRRRGRSAPGRRVVQREVADAAQHRGGQRAAAARPHHQQIVCRSWPGARSRRGSASR